MRSIEEIEADIAEIDRNITPMICKKGSLSQVAAFLVRGQHWKIKF